MEQAITLDPEYAPAYAALGAVQLAGGRAEKAASRSSGRFSSIPSPWRRGWRWRITTGPSAIMRQRNGSSRRRSTSDPDNMLAHRAMALFYLSDRRAPEAEPHFKVARRRIARRHAGARRLLQRARPPRRGAGRPQRHHRQEGAARAQLRIATIQYESGKTTEALRITDALISEKPRNPDAHILKARLLLAGHGDLDEAARQAQAAVQADTGSTAAQYTTGLVAHRPQGLRGCRTGLHSKRRS